MSQELPIFDKIAFCHEIYKSKNEYIVMQELAIVACEQGIKDLPDSPNKQRDTEELKAQIARFQDNITGANTDIENVKRLIEKYQSQKA